MVPETVTYFPTLTLNYLMQYKVHSKHVKSSTPFPISTCYRKGRRACTEAKHTAGVYPNRSYALRQSMDGDCMPCTCPDQLR